MLTKKQIEILKVFKENPYKSLSFSELKRELRESSTSKLQKTIKDFKKENLINITNVGRTTLISLNFNNNKLFDYFSIFNSEFQNIPLDVLYNLQEGILKQTEFFSLIVFGSYAKGKEKKNSDLDIAVIVESEDVKKKIIPIINSVKRKSVNEVHDMVFTRDEFLEMLGQDEENVGKEIARNNFVFYGLINFYKLISKEGKWKK